MHLDAVLRVTDPCLMQLSWATSFLNHILGGNFSNNPGRSFSFIGESFSTISDTNQLSTFNPPKYLGKLILEDDIIEDVSTLCISPRHASQEKAYLIR